MKKPIASVAFSLLAVMSLALFLFPWSDISVANADDTTTIAQLQAEITALQTRVATLENIIETLTGGGTPPPSNAPVGTIDPATKTVDPGSSVDFSGHNFGHEETVVITRNGTNVGSAHADGGGNFSTGSLQMPAQNGTYTFTFTGQTSGTVGTATIQVGSGGVQVSPAFTFMVSNADSVPPQSVATNVPNQSLGGFATTISGESISLPYLTFYLATSSTGPGLLTNISLVNENGSTIAGPFDATFDATTGKQKITFVGTVDLPIGTHTYTLKGKLPSTYQNGGTITLTTNPAHDWGAAKGDSSGITFPLTDVLVSLNSMTVRSGVVSIANSSNPPSQTIVAGGSNVLFANIQLDASQSGEDLRMSSLPVQVAGTAPAATTLSNCQVWNGTTALNTGSRVVNGASFSGSTVTFSFDNALTIPKGTVTTLGVTCNVSSGASGTYQFSAGNSAGGYSITGVNSGITILPTITAGSGPVMTVASAGVLSVSTDSSSPAYQLVAGGTTGVTANVLKFRASNEPVNLSKVGLKLTSGVASDLTNVLLYAGNNIQTTGGTAIAAGTLIGTASFTGNSTNATSTLNTAIRLPQDQDATLIVKADLADIGLNQAGNEGDLVAIDYLNAQGTGANSGITINSGMLTNSGVAGLRTFNTYPIVVAGPAAGANPNGSNAILKKFAISANNTGLVGLYQLAMQIATASAALTNLQLHAYTDANYSVPANVPGTTGGQFSGTVATLPSSAVIDFVQSTPFEIGAGSTDYFALTGNVQPDASATNWSVSAVLLGDSSFPSVVGSNHMSTAATISDTSNFVWSPNATTTASVDQNDWTNAYGVFTQL